MLFDKSKVIWYGLILDTSIWNIKYFYQHRNVRDACPRLITNAFVVTFTCESVVIFELYI